MIKTEDEIIVDLSTSCTKELAVGKLLGWMKGPIFPKVIMVNRLGTTLNLLQGLKEFDDSLEVVLANLREDASLELVAAAESGATYEELKEKEEVVAHIDSLIHNAFMFMSGLNEELSKAEDSEIKIDYETSKQTGVTHITLSSVNQWAKKKYGISILDDQEHNTSADNYQVEPTKPDMEEGVNIETVSLKTLDKNILTTLAFLVDAFFELVKKQEINTLIYNDKPNVSKIAVYLEDLALKANNGNEISGQDHETIRKVIARAVKEKNSRIN